MPQSACLHAHDQPKSEGRREPSTPVIFPPTSKVQNSGVPPLLRTCATDVSIGCPKTKPQGLMLSYGKPDSTFQSTQKFWSRIHS